MGRMKEISFFDQDKVLITGARGMAGSYLNFGIKTDRESLDVTDLKMVLDAGRKHKPKVIIHLAAQTDMDKCENDPDHAYKINAIGTYNMAELAKEIGAKMVYVSTGGVFDGKKDGLYGEDDTPNPQTYYGRSKYLGELIVRGMLNDYIIARTCWLFGGGPGKDKKFISKIISQFEKAEIKAVDDQFGSPTFAKDFIKTLCGLIKDGKTGIFHIVNGGACSRFEEAKEAVKILGAKTKITPVSSDSFPEKTPVIFNQGLISRAVSLRPWQEALREYIEKEWK